MILRFLKENSNSGSGGGSYGAYRGQGAAQGRADRSYRPY